MRRGPTLVVGAAIGVGMAALAAERGGADFLLALNAGRLRVMGAPSLAAMLPLHDANSFTDRFARHEILGRVAIPVLIGASAHGVSDMAKWCCEAAAAGYAGVANFPTVTHLDGGPRLALEEAGLGVAYEARLLATARAHGLLALGYAKTRSEVAILLEAGVDMLCLNFGWTAGTDLRIRSELGMEEVIDRARRILREVRLAASETLCLVEGGPIVLPEDVWRVCSASGADGYIGGSTLDRMPLEAAVAQSTSAFKTIALTGADPDAAIRRARRLSGLVGASDAMRAALARAARLAPTAHPVLVTGEAGSGRSAVARGIHAMSGRRALVALDAERAPTLAPDATWLAEGLDAWPASSQAALAQHLDATHAGWRLIATATDTGEVTLLPALRERLEAGRIALSPLRTRSEDIPALATHILRRLPAGHPKELGADALRVLLANAWPGNVRELRAVLERAALGSSGARLMAADLADGMERAAVTAPADERAWILDALRRHRFRRAQAAAFLGVSRKTLYNRMRRLGMQG